MELTQELIVNDLQKIKAVLSKVYGVTDIIIEYPGFLSIGYDGHEIHAAYCYDGDENTDGEKFHVYDYSDGVNDFSRVFDTNNDTRYTAGKIARVINEYLATR
jgi:hypothetical protein